MTKKSKSIRVSENTYILRIPLKTKENLDKFNQSEELKEILFQAFRIASKLGTNVWSEGY